MCKFNLEQHLMGLKHMYMYAFLNRSYKMIKGFVNLWFYFYNGMGFFSPETLNA